MEKRKPTYDLEGIKAAIASGRYRVTNTARCSAYDLGLNDMGMVQVVTDLTRKDFYKSMTVYHDSRLWQDVYRPTWDGIVLYIKFQIDEDGFLIVSFKEK